MASSHSYTIEKLLSLRDKGVPTVLSSAPQKGREQANHAAIQVPMSESQTLGRIPKSRPPLPMSSSSIRGKKDVSIASDDTVFVRSQPRRGTIGNLSTDLEWKFRGRAESEAATPAEPLSAPTGLNAQKSEGFQRFYKAVISPTHVRVTAGGRIVPNTPGASPMSKKPHKDHIDAGGQMSNGQQASQPMPHSDGQNMASKAPMAPIYAYPPSQFYPHYPNSMPQLSMMSLPMGMSLPGGIPFPQQLPMLGSTVPTGQPQQPAKPSAKEDTSGTIHGEPEDHSGAPKEKRSERGQSGQFDHTRQPYMVNGQVVYPYPAAGFPQHVGAGSQPQYMAPGFVGHSGFPVAPFPNAMMHGPLTLNQLFPAGMAYPQLPQPFMNLNGQQQIVSIPSQQVPSDSLRPSPTLPMSSIRPSDISRKQIELLRNSLKYHEDQLLYNRHQIDEKEMGKTIAMLQSQIDRFEALNKSQLMFEELHYPKKTGRDGADKRWAASASSQGGMHHGMGQRKKSGSSQQSSSIIGNGDSRSTFHPTEAPLPFTDPAKKSSLPSRAALAPPFEPRTLFISGTDHVNIVGPFGTDGAGASSHSQAINGKVFGNPPGTNQQNTMPCAMNSHASTVKPYLVGTLPANMNPQNAQSSDYVYERELNEDEIRSRYLFWGKAPAFTRKGLPKFDGKDFYPSSPPPDASDIKGVISVPKRRVSIGNPGMTFHDESLQPTGSANTGTPATHSFLSRPRKGVKVTLKRPKEDEGAKSQQESQNSKTADTADTSSGVTAGNRIDGHPKTSLPNVLRRNISGTSDALPSSFSSATAQGVLPQYSSGYDSLLAASLSPVVPAPQATILSSPMKSDEGSPIVSPSSKKVGENCRPQEDVGPVSLEQKFRSIVSLESKKNPALPVHWGAQ